MSSLDPGMRAQLARKRGERYRYGGKINSNQYRDRRTPIKSPFGSYKLAGLSFTPSRQLKVVRQTSKPLFKKLKVGSMNFTKEQFMYLLDKEAQDSQAVALQEYQDNRKDQRDYLMRVLSNSASAEKDSTREIKSLFSSPYESGAPLLKQAAREIVNSVIQDRAAPHFKEALVSSFVNELEKIGGMPAPPSVPTEFLARKATESSPFAIRGAMNPEKIIAKARARRAAQQAAKRSGLLSKVIGAFKH